MNENTNVPLGKKINVYKYKMYARHRYLVLGLLILTIFSVVPIVFNLSTGKTKNQEGSMYGVVETDYNAAKNSVRFIFFAFMGLVFLADHKDRRNYPKIVVGENGVVFEGKESIVFLWENIKELKEFGFSSHDKVSKDLHEAGGPGFKIVQNNGETFVILSTLSGYKELKKYIEEKIREFKTVGVS